MAGTVPADVVVTCPRCRVSRNLINISGGGITYRCSGCEWPLTLATQAPTSTISATVAAGAVALTVASGGASFTNGMVLLLDTGTNAEVVTVNGSSSGTSIPVAGSWTGQTRGGLLRGHTSGAAFGQLLASPQLSGAGLDQVPQNPF